MSEKHISINAPAKVNLNLRVLGKREDGYHAVDLLMAPLQGLHDVITLEEADVFSFECDQPEVPTDETNSVIVATRLFEKAAKIKCKARVKLSKKIPVGAGLGGGSSDAAAMLKALEKWTGVELGEAKLKKIAAEIGSDVPFFLHEKVARCTGRGENVEIVEFPHSLDLLLVKPTFGVSTADAYKRWADAKELLGINYAAQQMPWGEMLNDLEKPVFGKYVFLAELKMWLQSRSEVQAAMMSGSGSTIFAVLRKDAQTQELERHLRERLDSTLWISRVRVSDTP